jgi:hypothetical protein
MCSGDFMSWTIEQRWSQVLFVNWKVPAAEFQSQVPFPLDLHEGQAVLSLVPFFMDRVRFRGLPSFPFGSSLWEVNLRTYVIVKGVPGIYFFTLETPHRMANWIARKFFDLPYRDAGVDASVSETEYDMDVRGVGAGDSPYHLKLRANADGEMYSSEFQKWITERYHLYVLKDGATIRGDVMHEAWTVRPARVSKLEGGISILRGFPEVSALEPCFWANPMRVRFAPFRQV